VFTRAIPNIMFSRPTQTGHGEGTIGGGKNETEQSCVSACRLLNCTVLTVKEYAFRHGACANGFDERLTQFPPASLSQSFDTAYQHQTSSACRYTIQSRITGIYTLQARTN
jgi:hypothetical protein